MSGHKVAGWAVSLLLLAVPALLFYPLSLTLRQGITLCILLEGIYWWATALVNRTAVSLFLLIGFTLFSGVSLTSVFSFPLSKNFMLIAVSFLFSQGVMNSRLSERMLEPVLVRWAGSPLRMLLAMTLCSTVASLVVPQSISRTILVASCFSAYLDKAKVHGKTREVLLFGLFFTGFLAGMITLRGDLVLNSSFLRISGLEVSASMWVWHLAPPTFCMCLCAVPLFLTVFRKELRTYAPKPIPPPSARPLGPREKKSLVLISATVLLWATEPLHGLGGLFVVTAGTALMFPAGLLRRKDFRALDGRLLLFLSAAFSIGSVLTDSGLSVPLFQGIGRLFPAEFSFRYACLILVATMGIHLVLGSNVGTLAVALPTLAAVTAGTAPPQAVAYLVYIAVSLQFFLPFHHATLALGVGKGYFTDRQVLRFGIPLTFLTLAAALLFYFNWWRLTGLF